MATLILHNTHLAMEEEIKSLEKLKRETSEKIGEAADHGDLKENAEYHAAREKQSLIVYKIQLMQSYAPFRVINDSEITTDQAGFGNKVTIHEEGKNKPEDYYILGPVEEELDLFPFIVTYHSPFGREVAGKKVGEFFNLDIRGIETKFTVIKIEKISSEK
jgi:transcription elongation factor GreA